MLHEDYRSVSGVLRALRTREVDRATGKTIGTTRVVEVLHDPQLRRRCNRSTVTLFSTAAGG